MILIRSTTMKNEFLKQKNEENIKIYPKNKITKWEK